MPKLFPTLVSLLVVVLAGCALVGCGGKPPKPRSTTTIAEERLKLPGLFLTPSGKQKTAPLNSQPFIDPQSQEIFWPALECANPKCPGRQASGNPFLFVHPSPDATVGANGKIEYRQVDPSLYHSPECPECLKLRQPSGEAPAVRAEYLGYVRPHVLPETVEKQKLLDAEAQQLLQSKK